MKKSALFGACAMLLSSQASADYVSVVTGADMVDMEVTVTFTDSSTETLTWQVIEQDASVDYLEGFAGGVYGTGWSLTQRGDTISENPPGADLPLGAWTFTYENLGLGITSLFIDALAGGFVFDTAFGDGTANGSGAGRPFQPGNNFGFVSSYYTDNVEQELFGGLMLLGSGGSLATESGSWQFVADTDQIARASVTAPATLGATALAFGLIGFTRRKVQ